MAYFKNPVSLTRPSLAHRPVAEVLTIGNELLNGAILNTNARYLGKELSEIGFTVNYQITCPDIPNLIQKSLAEAIRRAEVIIVTGGLGPTPDDLTRQSLAKFYQVPLILSKRQYRKILSLYRKRRQNVPSIVKQEAFFPANAVPIFNRFGIALGFRIEQNNKIVIVLPGVPGELERLFESHIKNYLRRRFFHLKVGYRIIARTIGLSEATIMKRLGHDFFKLGDFEFGSYPECGEVTLRIYSSLQPTIQKVKKRILRNLGNDVYSLEDIGIEVVIGILLKQKRASLSVAESCTGGRVTEAITRVPGASQYFKGSVVAYSKAVKIDSLGVSKRVMARRGAVSGQTALAMAQGIRKRFFTSLGLSITGIAGPTGGSRLKPVGLVYIGISSLKGERIWQMRFTGDRQQIQERASKKVLEYLWRWLKK